MTVDTLFAVLDAVGAVVPAVLILLLPTAVVCDWLRR